MQRTPQPSAGPFPIQLLRFFQRIRIDGNRGVKLPIVERDPGQILLNQLARSYALFPHRLLHFRNTCFNDRERLSFRSRNGCRRNNRKDDENFPHVARIIHRLYNS